MYLFYNIFVMLQQIIEYYLNKQRIFYAIHNWILLYLEDITIYFLFAI